MNSREALSVLPSVAYDIPIEQLKETFKETFGDYYSDSLFQTYTDADGIANGRKILGWYFERLMKSYNNTDLDKTLYYQLFQKIISIFLNQNERDFLIEELHNLYIRNSNQE